ncbi:hypothetical protein BC936DRAFT_140537 [Jimgerdemannia flammicorona]|uniref:Uncharacterized protein n=1 Tax=Jimgerdemannia flammicorona TaxID=994334 RepID=A0A433APH1_9FUNG|nr:hypothetical protein BC936DRAFT_140537 [Jimgerdemannia flammicorona]
MKGDLHSKRIYVRAPVEAHKKIDVSLHPSRQQFMPIPCLQLPQLYTQQKAFFNCSHLLNLLQVVVLFSVRIISGTQGLFKIQSCWIFPIGVTYVFPSPVAYLPELCRPHLPKLNSIIFFIFGSLWHLMYLFMEAVLLLRCLIVFEKPQQIRMIKIVGSVLLLLRFADWPYEVGTYFISQRDIIDNAHQPANSNDLVVCYIVWEPGVLILGFIGDTLANLFFGGLFVYR